jgi:hypothetical protein
MRSRGHITGTDLIIIVAAALAVIFKPNDRLFWFFLGIASCGLLIQALPQSHTFFAH